MRPRLGSNLAVLYSHDLRHVSYELQPTQARLIVEVLMTIPHGSERRPD